MSKISTEELIDGIRNMLANRKPRKFQETIDLQIGLKVIV
jgi:hypothetical protein